MAKLKKNNMRQLAKAKRKAKKAKKVGKNSSKKIKKKTTRTTDPSSGDKPIAKSKMPTNVNPKKDKGSRPGGKGEIQLQTGEKNRKKRVSFAAGEKLTDSTSPSSKKLRRSLQIEDENSFRPEEETEMSSNENSATKTPMKSILKKRNEKSDVNKSASSAENIQSGSGEIHESLKVKKKKSFVVPRSVKEKLASMDRKQRRAYIRELKAKRKPIFDIAQKTKHLWERIRSSKTSEADKEKAVEEVRGLVRGKAAKLVFAHDTVRVIECLMALERPEIRTELFEELKKHILLMARSKYARFFVIKMLKYGTKEQRDEVFESFRGNVQELMRNSYGSEILEYAYNEFANISQRSAIVGEFYDYEYKVFKTNRILKVADLIAEDPMKKQFIVGNLREILLILASKQAFKYSLTHRLLSEYFCHCSEEFRSEMIETIKERMLEISHTRDGAVSCLYCVWHGTVKERKLIVKSMKGLAVKLCKEEYGHWVLLALFDTYDDTVFLNKYVLKEITDNLHDVAMSKYGLKVLHYLVQRRNPRIFPKEVIELLARGDWNSVSKKDAAVRQGEILMAVAPTLLRYVSVHMEEFVFQSRTALFVLSLLENTLEVASGNETMREARENCFEVLGELGREEFIPCNLEGRLHLVEHPQSHFLVTRMLKMDQKLKEMNRKTLSEVLVEKVSVQDLSSWSSCNKGCFVLLGMIESGIPTVEKAVKEAVEKVRKKLKGYSFQAAGLLLKAASKADNSTTEEQSEEVVDVAEG